MRSRDNCTPEEVKFSCLCACVLGCVAIVCLTVYQIFGYSQKTVGSDFW